MIEWARLELEKTIKKKKASAQKTEHQKQQARKDHLAKINSMSQTELNHLAYTSVFNFTPSARTSKERIIALKNANQVIANQKLKFRNFELRLSDATTLARRESQSMIFRRIGQVRTDSEKSSKKFRSRAKFIVSSEGPKKSVAAAKQRITFGKQKTIQDIKETEQMFTDAEQMFSDAQEEITSKKEVLQIAEEHRRVKIQEQGEVQLNLGKWIIDKAKEHMKKEELETQQMFSKARSSLKKGKIHLEIERIDTEKSFSDARRYLSKGKQRMQQEQADLKLRVQKDEQRIETERQRISALDKKLAIAREKLEQKMHQEKVRLSDEAKKVSSVSDQFSGAGNSAMGKISIVKKNLASQRARVLGQAKKGVKSPKVSFDRSSIKKNFVKKKEKLTEELIHKRELLAYDVRFKQHSLQSAASVQKETMTVKFENFQDEQKKLLARHRATRKSKMVRTLLRAIRTMH
jgi:hypothetical protein